MSKMGLLDRFEFHELSPRCEGEFTTKFDAFCEKIAALSRVAAKAKEGVE